MRAPRQRWIMAAVLCAALTHSATAQALVPPLRSNPGTMTPEARKQFAAGQKAYNAQEFERAAQGFTTALQKVPESPVNRSVRAFLVVDAMVAYQEAFELSNDAAHLRAGLEVYYAYFETYRETHGSTNIPEVVVEQRFAIKETLSRVESRNGGANTNATNTTNTTNTTTTTEQDSTPVAEADRRDKRKRNGNGSADTGTTDKSTPLIISGGVALALGAGASSMIAIGAINGRRAREDQKEPGYSEEQLERIDQQGRTANALFIAGLVTTPVFLVTGAVLLGKGLSDRRKAQLSFAPSVTPRFAGVVLRGRF
jgi:hypothetical protein